MVLTVTGQTKPKGDRCETLFHGKLGFIVEPENAVVGLIGLVPPSEI